MSFQRCDDFAKPFNNGDEPGLDTVFPTAGSFFVESAPSTILEPRMAALKGIGLVSLILRRILC